MSFPTASSIAPSEMERTVVDLFLARAGMLLMLVRVACETLMPIIVKLF